MGDQWPRHLLQNRLQNTRIFPKTNVNKDEREEDSEHPTNSFGWLTTSGYDHQIGPRQ